eukprot:TRINITY_DN59138_c0_g1_i1.p1 TRINITY_DN59138_c0_g1~~TRINITY_DN59138_c0_g1_i1.p1  ORF type:complete len:656 (-),score=157.02 TRINITY_DN59138_c0_g1_i1:244-2211(-)
MLRGLSTMNLACLLVLALLSPVMAISLPMRTFAAFDPTPKGTALIRANSFTSDANPIRYHFDFLPYCRHDIRPTPSNLGEVLWGDAVFSTLYKATMMQNAHCLVACERFVPIDTLVRFKLLIDRAYHANFIYDSLPLIQAYKEECLSASMPAHECRQRLGVRVGKKLPGNTSGALPQYFIHNHVHFDIRYHKPPTLADDDHSQYRVVGFHGSSRSIGWNSQSQCMNNSHFEETADALPPLKMAPRRVEVGNETKLGLRLVWTYSVKWSEDKETRWLTRWDIYFLASDERPGIHWFALVNALLVVLFLSVLVALIMLRALHRDFNQYNDPESAVEGMEETGWKQVHGDVFRRPEGLNYLVALVGSGTQLNLMLLVTLGLAVAGFMSPSKRGSMLTVLILMFVQLGFAAGMVSARLAKMWGQPSWMTTLLTAVLVPCIVLGIYLVVNIFMSMRHAANALPASALLSIFGLWLFVNTPLVFVGGVVGYRMPAIEHPLRTNEARRAEKPLPWYLTSPVVHLLAGGLPFAAAFLEIYFLFNSVWQHKMYFFLGFVLLVYVIMLVVVAEVAIVFIYYVLVAENWRIWWRAFTFGASPGIYIMAYSALYFVTSLHLAYGWAAVMFFGVMSIVTILLSTSFGAVAFLATFVFARTIYSAIKVE